jgi:hypothetical protein
MARAAKGFHASHSLGAILFSLVWGYLAPANVLYAAGAVLGLLAA